MLDSTTKRRIDTARDILVGKVPDPKTQVEQITFAMIYKFMDDMDQLSLQLGGKASFFTNGYEQYAWSKLMDRKHGGADRMDLYVRALEGMATNPHIPQLFRDIFKGAFMPYRDAETLNLFLKEMNGFTYAHSEDLGDAYEYLLSIFASQGKAGQFRTPRHIIDFIVDCVDPKKEDSVLDPACGTAGFLISAYKHILEQNRDTPLSGDQRERLTANFVGYDISPDMVRLSRVNMYLHQFPNPTIHEYDTLTYEDRWDENFDVILANPPFMTPKGGIRPHTRFAVQANRSEVLFVDYIAEHLNPSGRAGVIVPEGIIFQAANAYKALRKMLVDGNYLVAVISLPAGIFQPYSGVKTSVLLLDKDLAKRTDKVLFVKVGADGYDLGAQRREIERNDVPEALRMVKAFQEDPAAEPANPFMAQTVSKIQLRKDGEFNLSAERYKILSMRDHKWPMVKLEELLDYEQPTDYIVRSVDYDDSYSIPVLTAGKSFILGYTDEVDGIFKDDLPVIIFDDFTTASKLVNFPFKVKSSAMKILHARKEKADIGFIFHLMQLINFDSSTHKRYWISEFSQIEIPLPPLEEQRAIMAEIEGYQKIIDGARQVVENYKPVIKIDPSWPLVKLGDVCKNLDSQRKPVTKSGRVLGQYPYYGASGIVDYVDKFIFDGDYLLISEDGANLLARATPIAFSVSGKIWVNNHAHVLQFDNKVTQKFVETFINSIDISHYVTGTAQPKLNQENLNKIQIPLPNATTQNTIIQIIEGEMSIIAIINGLINMFEKKIADKLNEVWGET